MPEKDRKIGGKAEIVTVMGKLIKERLGSTYGWDKDTRSFCLDIAIEAMKQVLEECGTVRVSGWCRFDLEYRPEKHLYQSFKNDGTYVTIPAHNSLKVTPGCNYKVEIEANPIHYLPDTKKEKYISKKDRGIVGDE